MFPKISFQETFLTVGLIFPLSTAAMQEAHAQDQQEGLVETRILAKDPQSGVKSQHFYYVDFGNETVSASFATGTTKIDLGIVVFDVSSVRDNFLISNVKFDGDRVSFTLVGTTASGVVVMPDIDYKFDFTIMRSGEISVRGCHDAYPAYLIQHNGTDVYRFEHESVNIIKLFGTCDESVSIN
ncbi:MAG: DUF3238 domain-containing protein [Roseobacter sp.]